MTLGSFIIYIIEFFAAFHVVYSGHELYEHKQKSPRGLFYTEETSKKTQSLISEIGQNLIYTWLISVPISELLRWTEFDRKLAFFFAVICAVTPVILILISLFLGGLMIIIKILCKISKEDYELPDKYKDYPIVKNIFMDGTEAIIAVFVAIKLLYTL